MDQIIEVEGIGQVKVVRNKRSRQVKLRINHDGEPQISAPPRVPLIVIKKFVSTKANWINKHRHSTGEIFEGAVIGRDHVVKLVNADKFSVRIKDGQLVVSLTSVQKLEDHDVQEAIHKKAIQTLRKEAKEILPERTKYWASVGVGNYNSITIKLVRSRWGSYSSDGNINYSLFMAQLPDSLIDYVVVHELSHSVHMNHSKEFWAHVARYLPSYKTLRSQLKQYNMRVNVD